MPLNDGATLIVLTDNDWFGTGNERVILGFLLAGFRRLTWMLDVGRRWRQRFAKVFVL
jgi:hypothetical protein